jgi:hypothetical protein
LKTTRQNKRFKKNVWLGAIKSVEKNGLGDLYNEKPVKSKRSFNKVKKLSKSQATQ